MNDWFEWNGIKCTQYGIHVSEQPAITIPAERATFVSVPGRSGSLTQTEGDNVYDDVILTAECFVSDASRITDIAAWLRGAGTVTFANRQGGHYSARITNQIPFEQILRGNPARSFAVNFRCKPFFYLSGNDPVTLTESGFVENPGSIASEPVITVNGAGDITLMIGGTLIELTGVDGSITVDSELLEVYTETDVCNEKMAGEFPTLVPGINAISWDGVVSSVIVVPNWRTL